ncbi:MAG TPA: haloacid dehalogenase-like hydrolase [Streptosporangiaceae bacterium]
MRGRLVLWDIDFTLLNAGGVGRVVYVSVFRDLFGRDPVAVAPMAGRTERAIILETLVMSGISDPRGQVDAFVAELVRRAPGLREEFAARGHVLPGAVAALKAVAALGPDAAVQSVLTGNVRPVAEAKLAAFGLDGYLDLAVGAYGEEHEDRAELVHLAWSRAQAGYGRDFTGRATVLVGDTPLDVAAAADTGARSVGVATGGSTMAELAAAGADCVLPDLTDTPAVLAALVPPADNTPR